MAQVRNNKGVKTHLDMVAIYDKFAEDWNKKHDLLLTYTQITKKIAAKIKMAGGVKA